MAGVSRGFDFSDFWEQSDWAERDYTDAPPTDEVVQFVERRLGYKLPASYVEFMRVQNGGIPRRANHRTRVPTSWAEDHVAITGLFSIGVKKPYSLCGEFGSRFWIDEWGYPPIGVYFADCPSAGHDMMCLDFGACGPTGEPRVVHIDQESGYELTFVSENFESFIRGLEPDEAFEDAG